MPYTLRQAIEHLYQTDLKSDGKDSKYGRTVIFEEDTIEREWGWVFFFSNELYYRTRDPQYCACGIGPLFFNRHTGEVQFNSTGVSTDELIYDYEAKLISDNWVLELSQTPDRKASILRIKKVFQVPSHEARDIFLNAGSPWFTGHRRDLEWLKRELLEHEIKCQVFATKDKPSCRPFVLRLNFTVLPKRIAPTYRHDQLNQSREHVYNWCE